MAGMMLNDFFRKFGSYPPPDNTALFLCFETTSTSTKDAANFDFVWAFKLLYE
jgi:hypothetical protein